MGAALTARVRRHVLDVDLTLDLAASPVTVLFGPSGAGKTTLLRCIAGLDEPEAGSRIVFRDQVWFDAGARVPARRRSVGLLFQDHALFPHLLVLANVAYGLYRLPRTARRALAMAALEQAGAAHLGQTPVRHLSGGEAQRVALGRALAPGPGLLLLDEPLSALDGPTRKGLRSELRDLLRSTGMPAIVVTHDRTEALALGDRVAVVLDGRLRQLGRVDEVFGRPADHEVAAAVDTETVVEGRVTATTADLTIVDIQGVSVAATCREPTAAGDAVPVCIRAEDVALYLGDPTPGARHTASPRDRLPATITGLVVEGPLLRVDLDAGFPLAAYVTRPTREDLGLEPGVAVVAVMKASAIHLVLRARGSQTADQGRG